MRAARRRRSFGRRRRGGRRGRGRSSLGGGYRSVVCKVSHKHILEQAWKILSCTEVFRRGDHPRGKPSKRRFRCRRRYGPRRVRGAVTDYRLTSVMLNRPGAVLMQKTAAPRPSATPLDRASELLAPGFRLAARIGGVFSGGPGVLPEVAEQAAMKVSIIQATPR